MPLDGARKPILDLIDKVRSLIDTPDKWIKEYLMDISGRPAYCLKGAINLAETDNVSKCNRITPEGRLLEVYLDKEAFDLGFISPYKFSFGNNFVYMNNDPKTTHKDIMDLLNRVESKVLAESFV